jgi:hypothetical protein
LGSAKFGAKLVRKKQSQIILNQIPDFKSLIVAITSNTRFKQKILNLGSCP